MNAPLRNMKRQGKMLENRPHLQAEAVGDGKAYRSPLVINTARGNGD